MDIVKLRELLESELSSEDLANIDGDLYKDFYSLIKAYSARAESSRSRGETIEERLYTERLKIAEYLMREIIRIRLHKLIDVAFKDSSVELPPEERGILLEIKAFIGGEAKEAAHTGGQSEGSTREAETPVRTRTPTTHAYVVTMDVPRIMGPKLSEHGPIRSGDLVVLPDEIGKVLVERKVAFRVGLKFE